MAWHGMAWHGMAWHGMAWHGNYTENQAYKPINFDLNLQYSTSKSIVSDTAKNKKHSSLATSPVQEPPQQVISKQRVADHGEVYTNAREVNAMLDLVKHETERVDSRFLEPACGTGNFLVEILSRKLVVVESRYKKSQFEFERYAVIAVSSIYGIDILADNVAACQARLFDVFDEVYTRLYKSKCTSACRQSVRFILSRNILHGDALTLKTVVEPVQPIVFSEWAAVNGSQIKRRDFVYGDLVDKASERELPLFSDLGDEAFIPEPIQDYPLVHFLDLGQSTGTEVSHV